MIFEIWNDFVPLLLFVGLYVAFITAHIINGIAKDYVVRSRNWTQDTMAAVRMKSASDTLLLECFEEKLNFITRVMKRKEAPEDDADYNHSSILRLSFKNRGGEQWKINLYSLSIKDSAFSY